MTAEDLIEALDGVPPDKLHCPALAIGALRDALSHGNSGKIFNHRTHRPHGKRQIEIAACFGAVRADSSVFVFILICARFSTGLNIGFDFL